MTIGAMKPPSGEQYRIESADAVAVVTEVGATLRTFSVGDRPVLWSFEEHEMSQGGRGQVLAPWPNRLDHGRYEYRGTPGRAAIDEVDRLTAIHGLVRWLRWRVVRLEPDAVALECPLAPQPGYPFDVLLTVSYEIEPRALRCRVTAEGRDRRTVPFGIGFHPYFLAGRSGLVDAALQVPAAEHLLLDDRGLPRGIEALSQNPRLAPLGSGGLELGDAILDDCFHALGRDANGTAVVRFAPGSGLGVVELELSAGFDYVMCFTGDTLQPEDRRRAVAIEPMTCPPNALATSSDLVELAEGERFSAEYTIRAEPPHPDAP